MRELVRQKVNLFKGKWNDPVGTAVVFNGSMVAFFASDQDPQPFCLAALGKAKTLNADLNIELHDYLDNPHGDVLVVKYGDRYK